MWYIESKELAQLYLHTFLPVAVPYIAVIHSQHQGTDVGTMCVNGPVPFFHMRSFMYPPP